MIMPSDRFLADTTSPIIGREREIALAGDLIQRPDIRLLTLTGPGGIGKTRLAIELATRLEPAFTDGVRLVTLSSVSQVDQVSTAIAHSLGVRESGDADVMHHLVAALSDRQLLLVLDNLEHVIDSASMIVHLLYACPGVKIIATSTTLLRVAGEQALPVPPLPVPAGEGADLAGIAESSAAIRLFLHHARTQDPAFALTPANTGIVRDICRRLDGIPLAIELAASQVRVLPPGALLARIEAGLPLPIEGRRDMPDRHRTVRNAIAWSYDLLPDEDRRLFRLLGIFVGGCTVEAVAYVAGQNLPRTGATASDDGSRAGLDVLPGLTRLVDANLLQQTSQDGPLRFEMLETIRGFAREQLDAEGEADAAGTAHAEWFLHLAEGARHARLVPDGQAHLENLDAAYPNIRAALEWHADRDDGVGLLRLASEMSAWWYERSMFREGRQWLERALAYPCLPHDLAWGWATVQLGLLCIMQGDTITAERLRDEGVPALREAGDPVTLASALILQGAVANYLEDYADAGRLLSEALEHAALVEDRGMSGSLTARAFANLGVSFHSQGDLNLAMQYHERALSAGREHGLRTLMVYSSCDLGEVARDMGEVSAALEHYRSCLDHMDDGSDRRVFAEAAIGVANIAVNWHRPEVAARLLGAAEAVREQTGGVILMRPDRLAYERTVAAVRALQDDASFRRAWDEGRHWTFDEVRAAVNALSIEDTPGASPPPRGVSLSGRERDVLALLVAGHSDRKIAEQLFLSVRTVEGHVMRLRSKLGAQTRTGAVSRAIAAGLVDASQIVHDPPER